jgi:hypothetical protein
MSTNDKLSPTDGAFLSAKDVTKYRTTVGGLLYLTFTKPDISFAVNRVYQYLQAPHDPHWSIVKRILRDVLMLLLMIFTCAQLPLPSSAFSGADWAGCPHDWRFTGDMQSSLVPT